MVTGKKGRAVNVFSKSETTGENAHILHFCNLVKTTQLYNYYTIIQNNYIILY